nr:hypothetical protein [Spirochaeta sp.]
ALDTDTGVAQDIALGSDADRDTVALPDAPAPGTPAPGPSAPAADRRRTAPVRLFDLPFAHRLQSFLNQDGVHLVAATIAQTKDAAGDWTRPGAVYQADLGDGLTQPRPGATPPTDTARTHIPATVPLPLRPVLTEIHKNHGLIVDRGHLYITGAEGTYRAALPRTNDDPWNFQHIWHQEISELQFIDLDGDGAEELVTIEPFHGDRLVIYKVTAEDTVPTTGTTPSGGLPPTVPAQTPVLHLHKWLEKRIDFGHGLWTGLLGGVPSILLGNRAGHKNLELIRVSTTADRSTPGAHGTADRLITHTIAEGTGTAQVAVIHGYDKAPDSIIASNQEQGEIVRYTVS